MIVVVGSRHDRLATSLVGSWPSAALCSAEDLSRPGWVWSSDANVQPTWVVEGAVVDDERITGVFVRRSTVHPEELLGTHPDDRSYLAAEAHAFLVSMLATTRAIVVNPVAHGALGEEVLRPERWLRAAAETGVAVSPLRLTSRKSVRRERATTAVEVVGGRAFGAAPVRTTQAAVALARQLDLHWATFVFDGRQRLIAITCARPPGAEAVQALGRLLGGCAAR